MRTDKEYKDPLALFPDEEILIKLKTPYNSSKRTN